MSARHDFAQCARLRVRAKDAVNAGDFAAAAQYFRAAAEVYPADAPGAVNDVKHLLSLADDYAAMAKRGTPK